MAGFFYIDPANWRPFMLFGPASVITAVAVIFFAYIGFDVVSTTAEEVKDLQKDLPIEIIGSLILCTFLYIAMGAVLIGMVPVSQINLESPVASAFEILGLPWPWLYILSELAVFVLSYTIKCCLGGLQWKTSRDLLQSAHPSVAGENGESTVTAKYSLVL